MTAGRWAPIATCGDNATGEWAYTYAVELAVTPELSSDLTVVLHVNMHESFRWTDQDLPRYAPGVFDTTTTSFEPVIKFGANDYWMTIE